MAIIRITDLKLKAIIGINDWERKQRQDVIVNLSFEFDSSKAAQRDDIHYTIDYKALKKDIMALIKNSEFFLLEKLVEKVLDLIMRDQRIQNATVRIDKPRALRFAKSVSVESSRFRRIKQTS